MKKMLMVIGLLSVALTGVAQTITQQGVTYRYNGRNARTPLGKVYIKVGQNQMGVLSDSVTGAFEIAFRGMQMGSPIGNVTVQKRGMIVFNQQAVDEWSIRREPLSLILCDADEFDRQRRNYIAIGEREAKKRYDRKVAEIEARYEAESADWYQKLSEANEELQNVRRHLSEYADALARIDMSEMDAQMQEVIELYSQGEVEEAMKKLDDMQLMERFIQTLNRKQMHEQGLDVAVHDSIFILGKIQSSITLYKNSGQWDKVAERLKLLADRQNTPAAILDYARFCTEQNKHTEAITYYLLALDNVKGKNDDAEQSSKMLLADIYHNLATSYLYRHQYPEAEEMFNHALAIRRNLSINASQTDYQYLASTLNNLAHLYAVTQRFDESEAMCKEAIEIRKQLALENPQLYQADVAYTVANLAKFYNESNRFEEADTLYNEALSIYQSLDSVTMRKYYFEFGIALNGQACNYQDTRRFAEAESLFLQALEIRRQLAKDNPQSFEEDVAGTLTNLGLLYANLNRLEEAETAYQEALDIYRRLATENPLVYEPDMAAILNNIAIFYINTGHLDKAEAMNEEALTVRRRLAKAYPRAFESDLAITLNNLASIYRENSDFDKAEEMYQEALAIRRRLAAINPQKYEPGLAMTISNLAGLYRDNKIFEKAEPLFWEALAIRRRLAAANPQAFTPNVEKTLWQLSLLYLYMGNYPKAEEYARETLSMNPSQNEYNSNLAAALLFQGKYAEAEAIYRQYKDELKDAFLEDFNSLAEAGVIPEERKEDVERIKAMLNE